MNDDEANRAPAGDTVGGDWIAFTLTKEKHLIIRLDPKEGLFTKAEISEDLTKRLYKMLRDNQVRP